MICSVLIGRYANFELNQFLWHLFSFKVGTFADTCAAIKCDIGDMRLITDICECRTEMLICILFNISKGKNRHTK